MVRKSDNIRSTEVMASTNDGLQFKEDKIIIKNQQTQHTEYY